MFRLRSVTLNDLSDLFELSQVMNFINLPQDREVIEHKIKSSIRSFDKSSKNLADDHYIFVLEDLKKNKVIGVSMIHAQHGTDDEPHYFLKVSQEHKFSSSLNTGFIHGTLKLGIDTDGPTEIGGLVLSPAYRGWPGKLGKQLSFTRFLYMGINPSKFKPVIHSELMPPFDADGKAPLWEAIGRRFINMEYQEADLLSRMNKEFILNLFPSDTIYETLLPIEARNAIGKVGKETQPVKRMLESIGFKYMHEVDPFDGGPHYRCPLEEISLVKDMFRGKVMIVDELEEKDQFLVVIPHDDFPFHAVRAEGIVENGVLKILREYIPFGDFPDSFESFAITI